MKNIKEITDIFKQEIKKKYTSQITMPIYMGVSDMEIILEEIERLNNVINELEKRLISDRKFFEDVYKKSHLSEEEFRKQCPYTIGSYDHSVEMLGKLQELKGSDKSEKL